MSEENQAALNETNLPASTEVSLPTSTEETQLAETKKKKPRKPRKPSIKPDYRVRLHEDGKYHWLYDFHMLKNPMILIELYWVLGVTLAIFAIIMFLIGACSHGVDLESLTFTLQATGIMVAIFFVLGILGYLLYAAMSGWQYTVHFILDEKGVEHRQAPQAKKTAERIGCLTMLVGLMAKRPGTMGAGMLAASRTSMSSDFSCVRKVKPLRRLNTIRVNERFSRNQVYVCDEDFDFVYDYIHSHCPRVNNQQP